MKKTLLTVFALAGIMSVNAQTSLYSENFETTTGVALPAGWTQTTLSSDGGWRSSNPTTTYSSTGGLKSQYFTVTALTGSTRSMGTNDDGCNSCDKSADKLFSSSFSCTGQSTVFLSLDAYFYFATGGNSGNQEYLHYQISNDGGTTWSDIALDSGDAGWHNQVYDISSKAANQANVMLGFWYDDGADWGYGAVIDNIKVYAPSQRDVAAQSIDLAPFTALSSPTNIVGVIKNYGAAAITTMTLNYSVDGGAAVSQNLSSLNIAPLTKYAFTHGTPWAPSTTGSHTIKVWVDNINGAADDIHANDTISASSIVPSTSNQRTVLVEGFSSSTCGPCAYYNPGVHQLLVDNAANTPGGHVVAVKYQMNYPSPGDDPGYTSECNTRHTSFYGITGIPHLEVDGGNKGYTLEGSPYYFDQASIDRAASVPSPVTITASAILHGGDSITVSGTVNSYANLTGTSKVMIALIENDVKSSDGGHGTQANNETEWYWMMRKMDGGATGTSIGTLTDGGTYTFNKTAVITGYTGPGTGTPKIFTTIAGMTAVVWVQNFTNKSVYQAMYVDLSTGVDEIESPLSTLDIYPNPSSDLTNIKFTLKNDNAVMVNVYNMMGENVYSQNLGTLKSGLNKVSFGNADLTSGMYNVVITTDNQNTTRRLIIQK